MTQPPAPGNLTAHLLDRAKGGDAEAYNRLFALAANRLLLFIRMRLGEALRARLDSMDVLQEAYLEAHRNLGQFEHREDGAFARWLCRIAENRIRGLADHHGAKKRNAPGGTEPASRALEMARNPETGPLTAVARSEGRERLTRAMERLEEDERNVLLLRHFEDRPLEEIAELMGRSPTAVRRLLGRASLRLGEELQRGR
jgi:RNA polymerase sigma-70 factor (ECF subfamily)